MAAQHKLLALALMLLLLLCAVATVTAQDDEDEDAVPVGDHPPIPDVHITEDDLEINEADIPHIPAEDLENMDHKELIAFCKVLKTKFLPLVKHRFDEAVEAHIMTDAASLGKHLEDARHKHLKKDHEHFSCSEAQDIVRHSTAQKFMATYEKFATKAGPGGMTNDVAVEAIKELHRELKASHLVNNEALAHVQDAFEDMEHLGKWYKTIKASYDHVNNKQGECENDYMDYIKELHDISTDKMPDWEHIHMGIDSLVKQCEEDEDIRGEL
jgi:hypothetical protein